VTVSAQRRTSLRGRIGRLPSPGPSAASGVGVVAGLALVAAVFLPWYATNLGPPFSATSASGWESTNLARIALLMGFALAAAAATVVLHERRLVSLEPRYADALAWVVVGASGIALVVVGYRLVVMPDPAEFLSRQIGLYLGVAAATGGLLSGLAQIATRE
jgi:hypothetical protein